MSCSRAVQSVFARFTGVRVLGAVLATFLVCACSGGDAAGGGGGTAVPVPSSLILSAPTATINAIDGTATITATVRDAGGTALSSASVVWSSENPGVAMVSGSGGTAMITAIARGVVVINAQSGGLKSSVTVFVRTAYNATMSPSSATVRVGQSTPLSVLVSADDGASPAVTWRSSSPGIASVNAQGVVSGITTGIATITARAVSNPGVTATATISVSPPRGVVVSPAQMSVGKGESRALTAQLSLDPGEPGNVIWRTNHPLLASVDASGVVRGIQDGTAVIVALAAADTTLRFEARVNVLPVVRSITVAPSSAQLNIGQSQSFSATVVVDQGASNAITWSSSNPAVVSVTVQGVATALSIGIADVRARSASDSTRQSVARVVVAPRPVAMQLSTTELGLTVGRTASVSATVSGDPNISTVVSWTSRNPGIATVNSQGTVTAVGRGSTYLVASPEADASRQDSVRVSVLSQLATSWSSSRLGGPLIEDVVSMWAPVSSLAYAVNSLGDVFLWNGDEWKISARGADFGTTFTALHGGSVRAVTAVGTNGVIARFNGTAWVAQSSGTTRRLNDVWMSSETEAWAVGENGVTLRYADTVWTQHAAGSTVQLRGVWGNGSSAFAVGDAGTIRRWDGNEWKVAESNTTETLRAVIGTGATGTVVLAAGDFGTVVRWNGLAFEAEVSGTSASLLALAASPSGTIIATGEEIIIQRVNGVWSDQSPPYRTRFRSAAVDAEGGIWSGGERGLVMRRGNQINSWSTLSLTPDLLDVWSTSTTHSIAVGELGFIFEYNGSSWTRQVAPTLERLNTVWAASATDAFAAGDNGVILRYNGTAWVTQNSPTAEHIYAMWGASSNAVWAVTDGGDVLFWNGSFWNVVHSQPEPLFGVYGTSTQNVQVVGLSGTAWHWNGSTWTARHANASDILVALWSSDASNALAVGLRGFSSGVALRYNGTWTETNPGTSRTLSAVWGPIGFDLYAVGDLGTIVRFDGTSWATMTSGTSDFLWAVSGAPDASGAAFAVGLNGVVVTGQSSTAAARVWGSRGNVSTIPVRRGHLEPARGVRPAERSALPKGAARKQPGGRR